jgi:hypothetical protein
VPVRTIHAGPNPKYFGPERGVTYYNLVSRHSRLSQLPRFKHRHRTTLRDAAMDAVRRVRRTREA